MNLLRRLSLSASLALGLLAGCQQEESPLMRPGEDCVRCHRSTGEADELGWSAAGTVFKSASASASDGVPGVHVLLTDALGKQVTLTTNETGNFYTAEALQMPLQVELEYQGKHTTMQGHPSPELIYGSAAAGRGVGCNGCHSGPPNPQTGTTPVGAAPGRIAIPGGI